MEGASATGASEPAPGAAAVVPSFPPAVKTDRNAIYDPIITYYTDDLFLMATKGTRANVNDKLKDSFAKLVEKGTYTVGSKLWRTEVVRDITIMLSLTSVEKRIQLATCATMREFNAAVVAEVMRQRTEHPTA